MILTKNKPARLKLMLALLAIIVGLSVFLMGHFSHADVPTVIKVVPGTVANGQVTVAVNIEGLPAGQDVMGFNLRLTYDKDLLEYKSFSRKSYFGALGEEILFWPPPTVDKSTGIFETSLSREIPNLPPASGNILTITFDVKDKGVAQFSMPVLTLRDPSNNDIPVTVQGAQLATGLLVTTDALPGAAVGSAYSATLQAAGGTAPYTWAIDAGTLPTGLSLSTDGVITGIPAASGSFNFTVKVADNDQDTHTKNFTLSVLGISTVSLPAGVVGEAYNESLQAVGGTAPYTWAIDSGVLPAGLTLSGNVISGTPTQSGSFPFTVKVEDNSNPKQTATKDFTLVVEVPPLIITTDSTLPGAALGSAYSATLNATGGTTPYTWTKTSGNLPAGLALSGNVISGTPSESGTFIFDVKVEDSTIPTKLEKTKQFTLVVTAVPLTPAEKLADEIARVYEYLDSNDKIAMSAARSNLQQVTSGEWDVILDPLLTPQVVARFGDDRDAAKAAMKTFAINVANTQYVTDRNELVAKLNEFKVQNRELVQKLFGDDFTVDELYGLMLATRNELPNVISKYTKEVIKELAQGNYTIIKDKLYEWLMEAIRNTIHADQSEYASFAGRLTTIGWTDAAMIAQQRALSNVVDPQRDAELALAKASVRLETRLVGGNDVLNEGESTTYKISVLGNQKVGAIELAELVDWVSTNENVAKFEAFGPTLNAIAKGKTQVIAYKPGGNPDTEWLIKFEVEVKGSNPVGIPIDLTPGTGSTLEFKGGITLDLSEINLPAEARVTVVIETNPPANIVGVTPGQMVRITFEGVDSEELKKGVKLSLKKSAGAGNEAVFHWNTAGYWEALDTVQVGEFLEATVYSFSLFGVLEAPPANKPTASPVPGAVNAGTTVTLNAEPGAEIRYTTDGLNPTTQSVKYTGPITINQATTIKAVAIVNNKLISDMATFIYTISTSGGGGGGGVTPPGPSLSDINSQIAAGKDVVTYKAAAGVTEVTITREVADRLAKAGVSLELDIAGVLFKLPVAVLQQFAQTGFKMGASEVPSATVQPLVKDLPAGYKQLGKVYDLKSHSTFSQALSVTFSYEGLNLAGVSPDKLDVYYYNETTKRWDAMSGKVDKEKKTITFTTTHFSKYTIMSYVPPVAKPTFKDIQGHWAQQDIERMLNLGLVAGVSDTQFAPNRTITRAEFAALLVRAVGIDAAGATTKQFADVTSGKWYYQVVNAAAQAGLVSGYSATVFGPNDLITREQMAAMVTRAMKYKGKEVTLTDAEVNTLLSKFRDQNEISEWAQHAVAEAVKSGIVAGRTADTFASKANATRAEGAVMIYRMYNQF